MAFGLVIGTPVAVSFLPGCKPTCPAPFDYPGGRFGEDNRFIEQGALVWDRYVTSPPVVSVLRINVPRGSAFTFRWERSAQSVDVCVPIWPIPLAVVVAGSLVHVCAQHRNSARLIAARKWRRAAIMVMVFAGVVLCTVVGLSFACLGGVKMYSFTQGDEYWTCGVNQGAAFFATDSLHVTSFPTVKPWYVSGPFSLWWQHRAGDREWSIGFPAWPIAIAALGWGLWRCWRAEQSSRRTKLGQCLHCGYSLDGLSSEKCPECGESIEW